ACILRDEHALPRTYGDRDARPRTHPLTNGMKVFWRCLTVFEYEKCLIYGIWLKSDTARSKRIHDTRRDIAIERDISREDDYIMFPQLFACLKVRRAHLDTKRLSFI